MENIDQNLTCRNCLLSCMKEKYTEEDLNLINSNKSVIKFYKGKTILKQGAFVSQIAYLRKGVVKKVIEGDHNRNVIFKIIEKDNFIALPVIGHPNHYPFSVIALTDCEVCFIRNDKILNIMQSNTTLGSYLLKWYSLDYLYMYNKILTISTRNSHGKLASTLIFLTKNNFSNDILNLLSRRELAELASISVESANKILLELKQDKVIEINKKGIKILRLDLIEKLSTVG